MHAPSPNPDPFPVTPPDTNLYHFEETTTADTPPPLDPEELIQIRTQEALVRDAEKLHLMSLMQWNRS